MTTQKYDTREKIKVFGNFKLEPIKGRHYPIYWVVFPNEKDVAYAICGYMNRAFTLTSAKDWIKITSINDLFITNGLCEERERCLVKDCKYNKTTIESYAKEYNLPIKRLKKMWERLLAKVNGIMVVP